MAKKPYIKRIEDFENEVDFCFYIVGYIEALRGEKEYNPSPEYEAAYQEGHRAGEYFTRWLLLSAVNNKN